MTTEIPRTMGRGLTRLESYLPSTRGETVFGEMRRMLDRAPQELRDEQRKLDQAARAGTTVGGVVAQHVNERGRSRWGRMFGVSATRRAEEAELVELLGVLGGVVGGGIARAKVHYDERRRREEIGRLVWQVVSLAATVDGPVNEYNEALRWRVLDALDLTAAARARLAAAPLPQSYQALAVPPLQDGARDAVATYAFHAHANAAGEEAAARRIVPLLVRLGMSRSGGEHFAHRTRAEYRSELDQLSHHYRMLQLTVVGVGHRLFLPLDVIAEAAGRVVRFDPYEAARTENLRVLARVVQASAAAGAMALTGNVAPAMSIAAGLAQQLFGAAAEGPAVRGALAAVGADAGLPQAALQTWLAWNDQ